MIEIYAGKTALKTLQEQGFSQQLFTSFLGASGGPKWFCLYGMDRYLFGEFFKDRQTELNLIGSSAGAFRSACFAQNDPVAAIDRLAESYSQTVYSKNAKPKEITTKAHELLEVLFADNGEAEILENPLFKAHFIVAKSRGLVASENKYLQGAGLIQSYLRNKRSRTLLKRQFERFVFAVPGANIAFSDPDNIPTQNVALSLENMRPALLASGSIPMVMQGVRNIPGAPKGMYRDGGVIDYHFDLQWQDKGLTLYPHFNAAPKAGWFDKNATRSIRAQNYDKTVLICPSKAFVASLPHGKIPDRTDFTNFEPDERIRNWTKALAMTAQTGEALAEFVDKQRIDWVKPFQFLS